MRKNIDIDAITLKKLQIISAFEKVNVKLLIEKAVVNFVAAQEKKRLSMMTEDEKEDLGLLLLMQQVDKEDTVSKEEFLDALRK